MGNKIKNAFDAVVEFGKKVPWKKVAIGVAAVGSAAGAIYGISKAGQKSDPAIIEGTYKEVPTEE